MKYRDNPNSLSICPFNRNFANWKDLYLVFLSRIKQEVPVYNAVVTLGVVPSVLFFLWGKSTLVIFQLARKEEPEFSIAILMLMRWKLKSAVTIEANMRPK